MSYLFWKLCDQGRLWHWKNDVRSWFNAARNFFFTPDSNRTLDPGHLVEVVPEEVNSCLPCKRQFKCAEDLMDHIKWYHNAVCVKHGVTCALCRMEERNCRLPPTVCWKALIGFCMGPIEMEKGSILKHFRLKSGNFGGVVCIKDKWDSSLVRLLPLRDVGQMGS